MTVRVAIIGCGAAGRRLHLPGLRAAGADVVAFASRSRASAEEAAAEAGGGEVVDDWRELLGRDDIDAVSVCTPNASHSEIAVAAAGAGKHVLVEKPISATLQEADLLLAAARRGGVVVMPAHNMRFMAVFVAMRESVERGEVGEVRTFRCAWGHTGPEHWAPEASWFRDRALAGGGALIDLGVHAIDTLRAVLGAEPVQVSALVSGGGPPGEGNDVEDAAELIIGFAGGAIGTLQASWALASGSDHQLTIQGTKGTLHLDGRTPPTLVTPGAGASPLSMPDAAPSVFDSFVQAIEQASPPGVTVEDGRAAVAVVEAAYRSAASGRIETVASVAPSERGR